jgi:hypothetical protein
MKAHDSHQPGHSSEQDDQLYRLSGLDPTVRDPRHGHSLPLPEAVGLTALIGLGALLASGVFNVMLPWAR